MLGDWKTAAGILAAAALVFIFYLAKRALWSSIRLRTRAGIRLVVAAREEAELEQTVLGLLELRRERLPQAEIVIETAGRGERFIRMAGILAGRYGGITVI